MMYKTNFIVLVLSAARYKVVIWDDFERKNRTEISFNSNVRNIKLRKDMLVVVLDTKTFIFSFMNLKLMENVETGPNPYGLCGLATAEKAISKTLVVISNTSKDQKDKGRIKILNYVGEKSVQTEVQAHESDVAFISVNPEGTLICTASIKGTKLLVFSADSGDKLQTLRRGTSNATITSIVFHPT